MALFDYVALLKSIKAVVVFDPRHQVDEGVLNWLVRKHSFRTLGVPPGLYELNSQFRKAAFAKLAYPMGSLSRLFSELTPDTPDHVRDALVLSSCYASPLLVIDPHLNLDLNPLVIWEKRINQRLTERELASNLQLAGQVLLDFHRLGQEAHHALLEYVEGHLSRQSLEQLIAQRQESARRDGEKRFQHIKGHPDGKRVVSYLDPLQILLPWLLKAKRQMLSTYSFDEYSGLGMGLVCALHIHAEWFAEVARREVVPLTKPSAPEASPPAQAKSGGAPKTEVKTESELSARSPEEAAGEVPAAMSQPRNSAGDASRRRRRRGRRGRRGRGRRRERRQGEKVKG